ncbi:MAG TPA: hypothetical protein VF026_10655 [Ktedonobacteraceae bacterium]
MSRHEPRKTLYPVASASLPNSSPYCPAAARSHVAASAMGAGSDVALPTLMPAGPSVMDSAGIPSREIAAVE